MRRRRINNDNDSGWWIYPALVLGVVLFIMGSAEDDAGAFMCPRSSHYCSGVYQ